MMEYKGYQAAVEFDDEDEVFHGTVINLRDVITFVGTSVAELQAEFKASVDDYLALCAERGEGPQKPYSGRFVVRMNAEQHRRVALASAMDCMSLNGWIVHQLEVCAAKVIDSKTRVAADSITTFR